MKTLTLLAAVLTAGAIAGAGFVTMTARPGPAAGEPSVPSVEDDPGFGYQDPPEIEVSWGRSGTSVIVTFEVVDEPQLLDCRWHADARHGPEAVYFAWGNFTDWGAWVESDRLGYHCPHPDGWGTPWPQPWMGEGMNLTDADGDHLLSAGDSLAILDVATGDEVDVELIISYWGSWFYFFRWADPPDGDPST